MSHLRCWVVGCVAALFVGALATNMVAAGPDLTAARRVAREAETRLLAGLHKPIKAEWSKVPIEQVLNSLAETAGVNLWIDREALSEDGISLEELVIDLHLGETTVWQTLRFLLKPLLLDWHRSYGLLAITTQVRADEILITRTYDVQATVAALELQLKNLPSRQFLHLGGNLSGDFCGGGGGLGPVGQSGPGIPIRSQSIKGEELLSQLLMECLAGKWELTDGEGGTISLGRGRLIVRQTYQAHFHIRELLLAVEEFVVRGSKAKSMLIARPGYPHDEDAAIFKRLAEPKDIQTKEAPLDKTLLQLAQEGRYRLWIEKESLSADGIDIGQQVTLKLSGTTLDTVLRKLLDPLLLTFVVEEGTLVVTTKPKADERMPVRFYFTGDIPEARTGFELLTTIQEATSGKWDVVDGEGGRLWKVVPEWLVVQQTQAVHLEAAELLDDLRQAAVAPVEAAKPEVELRLYPVADATALDDLVRSLPKLIPIWDAEHGSIVVLGQSLAIKQPALVHDSLDEIFSALDQAHAKLNPPKPKEEPKPAPVTK